MKTHVYIAQSLDGFIADKHGNLDWLSEIPNPDNDDFGFADFLDKVDAIVMGRNTFEKILTFGMWPYPKPVYVISSIQIIPSLEYTRLHHKEFKAYEATASLTNNGALTNYTISYPALERTLSINFSAKFPYTIENWSERAPSGFGDGAKLLTTRASKIKTINTPYWQENHNSDLLLRDSLGLR